MFGSPIVLTHVSALIGRCWLRAEDKVADTIRSLPDATEEEVTTQLAIELQEQVKAASKEHLFSHALLADVEREVPHDYQVTRQLEGLVARVDFHDRAHEGRASAADLAVTILQPTLSLVAGPPRLIRIQQGHATAMLVQAKRGTGEVGSVGFKWGSLTAAQERFIPRRRDYFSYLLYRLRDNGRGSEAEFSWQHCKDQALGTMRRWFRSDDFPSEESTTDAIKRLAAGSTGTSDPKVIRRLVSPPSNRRIIEFRIDWPDDSRPPDQVRLAARHVEQVLLLRTRG